MSEYYEEEGRQQRRKNERDEKDEKNWEEKWAADPLGAVVWAAILIWAGAVLLLDNLGFLSGFAFLSAWSPIFLGAGLILLLESGVRVLLPSYRRGVTGRVILAFIFIGIGLGSMVGWHLVWPLVIIAIGVIMILATLIWRRR